jgi:hypothetical protein
MLVIYSVCVVGLNFIYSIFLIIHAIEGENMAEYLQNMDNPKFRDQLLSIEIWQCVEELFNLNENLSGPTDF